MLTSGSRLARMAVTKSFISSPCDPPCPPPGTPGGSGGRILIEGAIVTAQVTGEIGAVDHAKDIARMVIAGDMETAA